jgi:hypothetical protein
MWQKKTILVFSKTPGLLQIPVLNGDTAGYPLLKKHGISFQPSFNATEFGSLELPIFLIIHMEVSENWGTPKLSKSWMTMA